MSLIKTLSNPDLASLIGAPATVALRHANNRRAQTASLLAETIPGASIGAWAIGVATTITGGVDVNAYDRTNSRPNNVFRFTESRAAQASAGYPLYDGVIGTGPTSPNTPTMPVAMEFIYDGSTFDLRSIGQSATLRFRIWADGLIVGTLNGSNSGGNFDRANIVFADARPRFIKIEAVGGSNILGITRQSTATIGYPTTHPKGPRVIVLGDSYTESVGASNVLAGYASRLGVHMGWTDLWISGSGGTGYLNPASPGRVKFADRVTTDVINQNPDIVLITGGINDQGYATADATGTAAGSLFDTILSGLPNVDLRIVGPWNPFASAPPSNLGPTRDAIRAAAVARGLMFVDPMAEQWITAGNKATYIGGDNIHPTDAGHSYIADRIAGHMSALVAP